jgi:hypothetical protein
MFADFGYRYYFRRRFDFLNFQVRFFDR